MSCSVQCSVGAGYLATCAVIATPTVAHDWTFCVCESVRRSHKASRVRRAMIANIFRSCRRALACAAFAIIASDANAQQRSGTAARQSDPAAFLLESLGGSVGSLIGIGAVGLSSRCGVDDLGCLILKVGAGGVLGAIGATIGASLAARYTGSPRSAFGAALGAVAGTGVGLGIHYVLNNSSDRNFDDPGVVVPIFIISQGTFAAIGSRLLGAK
jgi:hypothetical protein